MKLYDELIDWYTVIDPHEDHAAEASGLKRRSRMNRLRVRATRGLCHSHDVHVSGLFARATWLELLAAAGFRTELIERPLDDEGRTDHVFLAIK